MPRSNPSLRAGDIVLDTVNRRSIRVNRVLTNERIEVVDTAPGSQPTIVSTRSLENGIANRSLVRTSATDDD